MLSHVLFCGLEKLVSTRFAQVFRLETSKQIETRFSSFSRLVDSENKKGSSIFLGLTQAETCLFKCVDVKQFEAFFFFSSFFGLKHLFYAWKPTNPRSSPGGPQMKKWRFYLVYRSFLMLRMFSCPWVPVHCVSASSGL